MKLYLLLADDDIDDCAFFGEMLNELPYDATLRIVNDGVHLMNFLLAKPENFPNIIFLDLNMPRKNGIECVSEIKSNEILKHIPIVIYSTSLDMDVVKALYEKGVNYYIRKPAEFSVLKSHINKVLSLCINKDFISPTIEQFVIEA